MAAIPSWLEPMAATLTRERFEGPEWVFARKLDGIRLLAFKRGTSGDARRAATLAQSLRRRWRRATAPAIAR